ncbi:aldehyde dehydrogenase family protein [Vibrio sp. Vb1026]|jgi:acyl-CoA reductase-like NAD-dependent aldehyde dehydrogenase|uniref:aldehyde dehydrogenase family protein n=1 Tax=Vibrio TaxID=662 RepID=UPI001BD2C649|nr:MULTISPECIES: aldehyde dehydrogenase family protein [Vibrio]MBT0050872.1 aldehyde dehydrogenase family protein [Vibrio alginolyticus]MDW1623230.1 aldehyde dehydrogenase family protein [Vibrio sp. Vb2704]MDW1742033.1 aldehyde dehydrogenase family protein [Vibrio sp. Vb2531]MDW1873742.1 aldehyde dehydrogenase family protein [Vibrio sp. Vb1026]MDW3637901.1 aldehyde dehydrogenase family protein [Vibrio sp. 1291-1]
MMHYLNYIDGEWCDSEQALTVINPGTAEAYATIAEVTITDADRAMAAARRVVNQGVLSDVRPAVRTEWMLKAAAAIREMVDEGGLVACRENGKSLQDAKDEFLESARYFEYYAGMADKLEGTSIPLGKDYVDFTQYVPFGVSVQIVPWNFPVSICARSLAPALAAGNAVVIKSPEISPLAMTLLIKAIEKAGFPKGAINLLCGKGSVVGSHLVQHQDVDQIVFTGSVPTGQRILKDSAQRATPSVMELGGKSAAIALKDVSLETLLQSVQVGIFFNAGQVCSAMSRLLIQKERYEEVKAAVVKMAQDLTIGQGESQPDITPLVSADQQARVLEMIEQAKADGANILTGGYAPDLSGYFVAPTVIEASPDMRIAQEEVFGPVLVITPFETEQEAVEIANGTDFGLVAGVFGESLNQTLRVAQQLRGGQVFINEWFAGGIETPFGGVGLSGFGREKGQEAIYSYVQTRNIAIRLQQDSNV